MSTDEIRFVASIPASAGAITIDGGAGEGGRIKLDVPGTHLTQLIALAWLRGKILHVSVALQQTELDLTPRTSSASQGVSENEVSDGMLAAMGQLAPAEGSGIASVEITADGRTATLTPETRKKVQAIQRARRARRGPLAGAGRQR